ncbi:pilus assembly protein TadG-related protein [Nocardioides piscis]|uniref:Putative Flp pilus-assembly TadG-like N-terminal domain-containing protein n=1 Tax=Nocardioides piscis TaxID=2714938 RepID=A0A6G7YCI9_9ACTN|nr:pilus assembly protein TadG-related protein [Nocardioides piscis]QIK74624.1 hypothetical protein G7071_03435 [Nocardioides piscis]
MTSAVTSSTAERGAATVLVLVVAGILMFVGLALAGAASLVVTQRRAQAAADLAALAGAGAAVSGATVVRRPSSWPWPTVRCSSTASRWTGR